MKALSTFRNLAGGRLPPLTRTALLTVATIFVLTLLIFRPIAGGLPPAPALQAAPRLVAVGDPRTEQVILLDSSAVYFPHRRSGQGGQGELGQAEGTPFPKAEPTFQFNPAQPLARDSVLQIPRAFVPSASQATPLSAQEPFVTFGTHGFKDSTIAPREAFFEIKSINGSIKPIIYGNIKLYSYINDIKYIEKQKNAPLWSNIEMIMGVDSLGKATLGSITRSSGSSEMDRAVLAWAAQEDWPRRLSAGTYRLTVGP